MIGALEDTYGIGLLGGFGIRLCTGNKRLHLLFLHKLAGRISKLAIVNNLKADSAGDTRGEGVRLLVKCINRKLA